MPEGLHDVGTWFQAYRSRPLQSPESFGALCLGRAAIGFVGPDAARALVEPGLAAVDGETLRLPDPGTPEGRAGLLEEVQRVFIARGLAPEPTGEALGLFALRITPSSIEPVGDALAAADRSLFRALGALTHVVHLTATQGDAVLLGLRPATKRIGPGLWDSLAAGMVRAGETPEAALAREALEEARLDVALLPIRTIPGGVRMEVLPGEGLLLEKTVRFATEVPVGFPLSPRPGEVDRIEAFPPERLADEIAHNRLMSEAAVGALEVLRPYFQP